MPNGDSGHGLRSMALLAEGDSRPCLARYCIDLLSSPPITLLLGPVLARRGPLPVRVIGRIEDLATNAILVSDSRDCSVEECRRLTDEGTTVVILAMLPLPPEAGQYMGAGASAYLAMTVDDRLITVLDALAAKVRVGGRLA